jgi:hypothetical protein
VLPPRGLAAQRPVSRIIAAEHDDPKFCTGGLKGRSRIQPPKLLSE